MLTKDDRGIKGILQGPDGEEPQREKADRDRD